MKNRGLRRELTERKYISRIKKWLPFIKIKDKSLNITNSYGYRRCNDWREAESNIKWVKLLKHNKLYGRSTMNVLEKHFRVKKLREETKKLKLCI